VDSFQETAFRNTAKNPTKNGNGGVAPVTAKHCGVGGDHDGCNNAKQYQIQMTIVASSNTANKAQKPACHLMHLVQAPHHGMLDQEEL